MANEQRERGDLILPPNQFAFRLDRTKGKLGTVVGPHKVSLSDTDAVVIFNPSTRSFDAVPSIQQGVQNFSFADESSYLVLTNPAPEGKNEHPNPGQENDMPELRYGCKINVAGPTQFALWPGQVATAIKGHTLRSNQYLVVEIYNAEEAKRNWSKLISAPQQSTTSSSINPSSASQAGTQSASQSSQSQTEKDDAAKAVANGGKPPTQDTINTNKVKSGDPASPANPSAAIVKQGIDSSSFVTGQKLIIAGTEISFFIPPTGVQVVPDADLEETRVATSDGIFVRNAVTLERLEYCILMDEEGNKRYERGPKVVFPKPTETFIRRKLDDGSITRRFRAYGLTALQGIHLQVIADYEEDRTEYKAGTEIFIDGTKQAIYYPRPEHAIIKYGDQEVHNSITIPEGEGRYMLDRTTGKIPLVVGPKMLLPNPITQVIVRRVLTDAEVGAWFPGNAKALQYNRNLATMVEEGDPASRGGNFIADALVRSATGYAGARGISGFSGASGYQGTVGAPGLLSSFQTDMASLEMSASNIGASQPKMADEIKRGTSYTPPRMLTLDTRYDGAVSIRPSVGYAVLIVSKTGRRRVVAHPQTALLEYDESLESLSLSTGTPKTHDRPLRTAYLQVFNNRVSDKIHIETIDMVKCDVNISMRVNFEGSDQEKWFAVENYVKLLTEHVRSKISAAAKRVPINTLYQEAAAIIRDTILGKSDGEGKPRAGMFFAENHMRVTEVEVTAVQIADAQINTMLQKASVETFQTNIEIESSRRKLEAARQQESIAQSLAAAKTETKIMLYSLEQEEAAEAIKSALVKLGNDLTRYVKQQEVSKQEQENQNATHASALARNKETADQDLAITQAKQKQAIELMVAESEAVAKKFGAIQGQMSEALLALGSQDTMQKIAQASSLLTQLGGKDVAEVLTKVFEPLGMKTMFENLMKNAGISMTAAGMAKTLLTPANASTGR